LHAFITFGVSQKSHTPEEPHQAWFQADGCVANKILKRKQFVSILKIARSPPTKKTAADFMTKPLQGSSHRRNLRDNIMGRVRCIKPQANVISLSRKTRQKLIKKSKVNGKRRITVCV